jgi:hypothetical protein
LNKKIAAESLIGNRRFTVNTEIPVPRLEAAHRETPEEKNAKLELATQAVLRYPGKLPEMPRTQ